jgi:hypothetical protein
VGYYAASSANPLPTFRDNLSVPSSRVKKSTKKKIINLLFTGCSKLEKNVLFNLPVKYFYMHTEGSLIIIVSKSQSLVVPSISYSLLS